MCDDDRAQRLLTLTGLTPDDLRASLAERHVQAAILGFLAGHEPDLIEAAVALGVSPETLAAAGAALDR